MNKKILTILIIISLLALILTFGCTGTKTCEDGTVVDGITIFECPNGSATSEDWAKLEEYLNKPKPDRHCLGQASWIDIVTSSFFHNIDQETAQKIADDVCWKEVCINEKEYYCNTRGFNVTKDSLILNKYFGVQIVCDCIENPNWTP